MLRFLMVAGVLASLGGAVGACGGRVVVDGPGGGAGGASAPEPCACFDRWCAYVETCSGATRCSAEICKGASTALQCLCDLPADASCEQMAVCGGD